ncbi:PAAR-like domain-containing protein [uncultured Cohaesibacter sp.]|uniref:PAAR-like domain-containing protein n=1 Tax=uncultured Cohaesibacter sp. TaxID=1002546 RepID=UPI0029C848C0|nr:PAAR-like domain-containing protein [uncultured Cohaesibacter sp.]
MFVNTQGPLPGMDMAPVDVFLLPTPVGPVPTPVPNVSMRATEIPDNFTILMSFMPSHDVMNQSAVSVGGPGPGVASGFVCGPSRNMSCSFKLLLKFMCATRSLMDVTGQNGATPNSVGMTVCPNQIRVVNLM